jgi:Transposase DDE domain
MSQDQLGAIDRVQVRGVKYLDKVFGLLAELRDDGRARDRAGNRTLFYDRYASLVLLSMFSPAMDSLRAIQQASALAKVRKRLGTDRRFSLGSLSEAARVFDPALLEGVVRELGEELLPLADCYDPRLAPVRQDLRRTLMLVDGTLLKALPRLASSMWTTSRSGNPVHGWRLHCQFDLSLGVPVGAELTDYCNSRGSNEREVLREHLAAGRCYVMDRGYFQYDLFDAISLVGSDYVCRVKKSIAYDVVAERKLDAAALAAGVTRDVVVRAGCATRVERRPNHAVRLVHVRAEVCPRAARGSIRPSGPPETELLILATNMLDVPAEVVALIYRYRWTVELFFRFFKQVMGCRHLLSDDPDGVRIQCYCAVIACMLLALWTGRKPDKSTWRMVGWFLGGMADEAEVLAHLRRPDNTGVKLAAKAELWKKLGL